MSTFYDVNPSFSSPKEKSVQFVTDGNNNVWINNPDGSKTVIQGWVRGANEGTNCAHAPPLGIYTDNSSIPENKGFQTLEKFKLLHHVRKIIPKERTARCFYSRISKDDPVSVFLNKESNRANYGNVARCANPWGCPVCASIISETRKKEVKKAMDWWQAQGGSVLLLTLTAPHTSKDDIKGLKKAIQKAYGYLMKGTRKSQNAFKHYHIKHYISAFEVTHGENGFHPHFHVLLFTDHYVVNPKNSMMRHDLYQIWQAACVKSGLGSPSKQHGLDLQNGDYAAQYVSKWGLEHEMTKGHIKKGNGSRTPFDLLRDYSETGDEKHARLFALYYFAFKGSRQLNWSQGLKAMSKNHEMTDEEIVNDTDKLAELMFQLDIELWHPIRSLGKQGELKIKVQEDHSLKLAMDFVKECLVLYGSNQRSDCAPHDEAMRKRSAGTTQLQPSFTLNGDIVPIRRDKNKENLKASYL